MHLLLYITRFVVNILETNFKEIRFCTSSIPETNNFRARKVTWTIRSSLFDVIPFWTGERRDRRNTKEQFYKQVQFDFVTDLRRSLRRFTMKSHIPFSKRSVSINTFYSQRLLAATKWLFQKEFETMNLQHETIFLKVSARLPRMNMHVSSTQVQGNPIRMTFFPPDFRTIRLIIKAVVCRKWEFCKK